MKSSSFWDSFSTTHNFLCICTWKYYAISRLASFKAFNDILLLFRSTSRADKFLHLHILTHKVPAWNGIFNMHFFTSSLVRSKAILYCLWLRRFRWFWSWLKFVGVYRVVRMIGRLLVVHARGLFNTFLLPCKDQSNSMPFILALASGKGDIVEKAWMKI